MNQTWPSPEDIMQAVCTSMSTSADAHGIYSLAVVRRSIPLTARDISERREKHPPHVDARAFSVFIYRYHVLVPEGYGQMKTPKIIAIGSAFAVDRFWVMEKTRRMCQHIATDERYRRLYIGALRLLKEAGKALSAVPKDLKFCQPPCQ